MAELVRLVAATEEGPLLPPVIKRAYGQAVAALELVDGIRGGRDSAALAEAMRLTAQHAVDGQQGDPPVAALDPAVGLCFAELVLLLASPAPGAAS